MTYGRQKRGLYHVWKKMQTPEFWVRKKPHQGTREMERRKKQLAKLQIRPSCEICGREESITVASSAMGPMSFGYGKKCIDHLAEHIEMVMFTIWSIGIDNLAEWALDTVTFIDGKYITVKELIETRRPQIDEYIKKCDEDLAKMDAEGNTEPVNVDPSQPEATPTPSVIGVDPAAEGADKTTAVTRTLSSGQAGWSHEREQQMNAVHDGRPL
jgi:hypothetical protein